jgi:hypothetical protein
MIYNCYTFQDCYNAVSPLQAYFLPSHGNWEASVLGKLSYVHCQSNNVDYDWSLTCKIPWDQKLVDCCLDNLCKEKLLFFNFFFWMSKLHTPFVPNYLSLSKKVNVPNYVAGFTIDQTIKIFFEILTICMERDATNWPWLQIPANFDVP